MTEVLSANRKFQLTEPVSFGFLQKETEKVFMELGDELSENGMIPGHIKGILTVIGGFVAFSVTLRGIVDVKTWGTVDSLTLVDSYEITINVLSLHPIKIDLYHLFQQFVQSVEKEKKRRNRHE